MRRQGKPRPGPTVMNRNSISGRWFQIADTGGIAHRKGMVRIQAVTYMLYNAASFPPEPVDNSSNTTSVVVQEALRVDIFSPQDCDLGAWPDRTEKVQGGIWAVVGKWVVVLREVSKPLCCTV